MHRLNSSHPTSMLFLMFGVCIAAPANAQTTHHVNRACGNDAWSGASSVCSAPDGPKATIQAAINVAVSGDTVQVADGTYTGAGNKNLDFAGRLITVQSENGAANCIIDCQNAGRGFLFQSGETGLAMVVGFTIRNGQASSGGGISITGNSNPTVADCLFENNSSSGRGGGVSCSGSDPLFDNCTFSGNSASTDDAGMLIALNSNATVRNCLFENNSAAGGGGGMGIIQNSQPTIENCVFRGNTAAGNAGGGIVIWLDSSPTITNCVFENNSSSWRGGGIMNWTRCSPSVSNCLFIGNQAGSGGGVVPGGGGMYNFFGSNPTVSNCTFFGNSGWGAGGAILNYWSSSTDVSNCILWGNDPNQITLSTSGTVTVRYSDVQGGWPGTGNISANPQFADPINGDYHVSPASPCIDAGINNFVPPDVTDLDGDGDTAEPLPIDLGGNPRFVDDPATTDTGTGTPPIVEMGAYEFQGVCPGDTDGDNDVDLSDLANVLAQFGLIGAGLAGDVDDDNDVDLTDLAIVLGNFGQTCT